MRTTSINDKLENDLDIYKEMFIVLKLASKCYKHLCKKYDILSMQFQVLYLLNMGDDTGIKMSTLGENLGIEKSGITLLVDKMALKGLVIRRPNLEDRRILKVMITEKGRKIMEEVFPKNEVFKVSAFDFIKQDEKELLCRLIAKLKEKLEIML